MPKKRALVIGKLSTQREQHQLQSSLRTLESEVECVWNNDSCFACFVDWNQKYQRWTRFGCSRDLEMGLELWNVIMERERKCTQVVVVIELKNVHLGMIVAKEMTENPLNCKTHSTISMKR